MVIGVGPLEGDLGNESGTLIKEIPENSLTSSTMWRHREKTDICQSGRSLSPNPSCVDTLILDILTWRTMRNKCLLFKLHIDDSFS